MRKSIAAYLHLSPNLHAKYKDSSLCGSLDILFFLIPKKGFTQPKINTVISGVVGWCDGSWYTTSAGAPYNLDDSRARSYCACSRCGWGLFGIFTLVCPFSPLSPSLWETAR